MARLNNQTIASRSGAGEPSELAQARGCQQGMPDENGRRKAWCERLGVPAAIPVRAHNKKSRRHGHPSSSEPRGGRTEEMEQARRQIALDVNRAFHFSICREWTATERERHQRDLTRCLEATFARPTSNGVSLYYYQGAHDIAAVLVLALGVDRGKAAVRKLFEGPLSGFARKNLDVALCMTEFVAHTLAVVNPTLSAHLREAEVQYHFTISWVLTWFAHVVYDWEGITAIYDTILLSQPLYIAYMAVALVSHYSVQLQALGTDFGSLYTALQALPRCVAGERSRLEEVTLVEDMDSWPTLGVSEWLAAAQVLATRYPPRILVPTLALSHQLLLAPYVTPTTVDARVGNDEPGSVPVLSAGADEGVPVAARVNGDGKAWHIPPLTTAVVVLGLALTAAFIASRIHGGTGVVMSRHDITEAVSSLIPDRSHVAAALGDIGSLLRSGKDTFVAVWRSGWWAAGPPPLTTGVREEEGGYYSGYSTSYSEQM